MFRLPKYLRRLIGFGFVLSAIPVIVLGIFSYMMSSHAIQNKLQTGDRQLLSQMKTGAENNLEQLDNALTQFIGSQELISAMSKTLTPDDFNTYEALSSDMRKLPFAKYGVDHFWLISFEHNWIISNGGWSRSNLMRIGIALRHCPDCPGHPRGLLRIKVPR